MKKVRSLIRQVKSWIKSVTSPGRATFETIFHQNIFIMKNSLKLFLLLLVSAVILPGFISPNPPAAAVKVKYSKKVNAIIQNKCYGCHSPESRGEKARKKLNWDELPGLDETQQLEKITSILGVLDKGAMPPKSFVEKDPSKALTEKETAQLKKWASKLSRKLSK